MPATELRIDSTLAKGQRIGWCTRCGGEELNYIRHVCRKPMEDAAEMIRTKQENVRLRTALAKIDKKSPQLVVGHDPGRLLAMEMGMIANAALGEEAR